MQSFWHNNGEPDENGFYIAEVQDDNGKNLSTYKGKSVREVADKLLESNTRATAEIGRLKTNRQPDQGRVIPIVGKPEPLTPEDRILISSEINDPDKADAAIAEVIRRQTGVDPATLHHVATKVTDDERSEYEAVETGKFIRANPDYYKCNENRALLLETMSKMNMPWTSNNLQIVYDELKSQGLLIEPPDDEQQTEQQQPGERQAANPAAEPNPPGQPRPRRASIATGFRSSDSSAQRPSPTEKAPKYTAAQIANMGKDEYAEKMRDPEFRRFVDSMGRRRA